MKFPEWLPLTIGAFLIGWGAVLFSINGSKEQSKNSGEFLPHRATDSVIASVVTQNAESDKSELLTAQLAPLMAKPVQLQDSGMQRQFELSKSELYLRQADGSNRIVAIPQADTPETFVAEIEKVRAQYGTEPELVLYPVGLPRNEFTRRIVTRQVVLNAPTRAEADALAAAHGLVFQKTPVFAPNSFVYEAPTSAKSLLVQTDKKASIEATPLLASRAAKMSMPNDPFVHLQWHLKYQNQQGAVAGTDINVESVWNYPSTSSSNSTRGRGVVIGIVDDGLQWSHPDLRPNVLPDLQYDWNGKDNDPNPLLHHSHGTQCGGVAAARGNNRIGVSGVAPDSGLAGMRLIAGDFTDLDVAEAMTWKMDEIHVLSNSWGRYAFETDTGYPGGVFKYWFPINYEGSLSISALKYAADFGRNGKGTIITFAAGNHDKLTPSLRAARVDSGARVDFQALPNSIYTIAVGAVDSLGSKAYYSQIGSSLLICAPSLGASPSLGIMTTDNKGLYGSNSGFWSGDFRSSGDVTKNFNGTSAACPVVSGVVALMLEKNPDLGWRDVQEILILSANRSFDPADWTTNAAGIQFNYKYGAGLVNAAEAVRIASTWNNLAPQKSQTLSSNATLFIAPGTTENQTFTLNGTDLRVEHVTLRVTIEDIYKGNLEIKLTSPDGTESVFCEPHSDNINNFTNWTFMTVRNWGESSKGNGTLSGNWTLSITNHGATPGSLTNAELVVYGTEQGDATNPAPIVTLETSKTSLFVGANLTLTATAIDKKTDGSDGSVELKEAFVDGVTLGESTNGTWTIQANKAGNYTFTVNATDGDGIVGTSKEVKVEVLDAPIAAWDFDTATINSMSLATAFQSKKQYEANFGSGNLIFGENLEDSNLWSFKNGEIWKATGNSINAKGEMWNDRLKNNALLLRGGKNIGAEGKCFIFEFSMVNREQLNVSYAFNKNSKGFTTHTWSYSTDGTNWTGLQTLTPTLYTVILDPISVLAEQAKAYLRVQFTGATAANGENLIDNIYFSASPITVDPVSENFTVLSRTTAKSQAYGHGSEPIHANETLGATSQAKSGVSEDSQNLDWVLGPLSIHEMTVHAEVVEGGQFLNAPESLLSANVDGRVLGLAAPVPQTTRYDLEITSDEPSPEPLRLKVYDSKSKSILVLEENVPFASGSTIGSPSTPKRYKVAYQEAEQVVSVAPGWNTFTMAVDPDPATLAGAFADYDYSEGDQLVGPNLEASVVDGKWNPVGVKLEPKETYSLLRQARSDSRIVLKGKELKESSAPLPIKPVELPSVKSSASASNSGHSHSPAPATSSGGGSESVTKPANSTKGSKKAKSSSSSKKKSGKKTKAKTA